VTFEYLTFGYHVSYNQSDDLDYSAAFPRRHPLLPTAGVSAFMTSPISDCFFLLRCWDR